MEHNQVCYFVDRDVSGRMYVVCGIYEYKGTCTHVVSRLKNPEVRLINGIPFDEFTSETEFKKVPKGWTYNTPMYTVTEDLEKIEKINAAMEGKRYDNPSDVQWLFDNGFLVKKEDIEPVIEAEYDHDRYRIVKKYPAWTICIGRHNTAYPNHDEVFETYEEAQRKMEEIKEHNHQESIYCTLLDFFESLDWALNKYEADHGGREIDTIRQKILERPHYEEIVFRYYKGNILIGSRDKDTDWEIIA